MWRDVFVEKTVCQLDGERRSKNSTTMSAIAVAFLALRHDDRCRLARRDGLFGSAVQQDNTDRSERGASTRVASEVIGRTAQTGGGWALAGCL